MAQFDGNTIDLLKEFAETIQQLDGVEGMPSRKKMVGALLIFLGLRDEVAVRTSEHEMIRRVLFAQMHRTGVKRLEFTVPELEAIVKEYYDRQEVPILNLKTEDNKFVVEVEIQTINNIADALLGKEGGLKLER